MRGSGPKDRHRKCRRPQHPAVSQREGETHFSPDDGFVPTGPLVSREKELRNIAGDQTEGVFRPSRTLLRGNRMEGTPIQLPSGGHRIARFVMRESGCTCLGAIVDGGATCRKSDIKDGPIKLFRPLSLAAPKKAGIHCPHAKKAARWKPKAADGDHPILNRVMANQFQSTASAMGPRCGKPESLPSRPITRFLAIKRIDHADTLATPP